jgi:mutator protein MutT
LILSLHGTRQAPRPNQVKPNRIIDVAAGLVFHDGKLLITQRRPDDHLGGLWEFPGGKVEPGETFEHCLVRELREELGIEVGVGPEVEDLTHSYPEKTVRLKFFLCRLISGQARPIHCHDVAWIEKPELDSYEFPAADAHLLSALANDWAQWNRFVTCAKPNA